MKKEKILRILHVVLLVLTLSFIWGQSFLPTLASRDEGNAVIQTVIGPVKKVITGEAETSDLFRAVARKYAHAAEFAVLGLIVVPFFRKRKLWETILPSLFICMGCGLIDETIQIFNDRSARVIDVWIDTGGAIAGIACGLLCILLVREIRKKKEKKTSGVRR